MNTSKLYVPQFLGVLLCTALLSTSTIAGHSTISSDPSLFFWNTSTNDWDIGGKNTGFFIIDQANSQIPFSIGAGGPSDSLVIESDGNVGVGTGSPASKLHVQINSNQFELPMVVENTGSDNFVGFRLQTALGFIDFNNSNQEFRLNIQGSTAGPEFRLNAGGNLTIKGTLTQGLSRSIKTNIVSVDGQTVLDKLALLDVAPWRKISAPALV